MATQNFVIKDEKTNIIVITGNDEILQNFLAIIQTSENRTELDHGIKHVTTESIEDKAKASYKRRKTDLTCVICADKCSGYNFNVISCASCKSFFHRNMSQNLIDLECLTNTNKCNIKFNNKRRMCRRCRLEKCLSVGMKLNSVDEEKKLHKQRQLEENRRLTKATINTFTQTKFMDASLNEKEQSMDEPTIVFESQKTSTVPQRQTTRLRSVHETRSIPQNRLLTLDDYNRLNSVNLSYEKACRLTVNKHDISALARIHDQRSALVHSMSTIYDLGMQLITFLRNIPEFKLLDGHDRFVLAKNNTPLAVFMRICLNYDTNKDLVIDPEIQSEEYAVACKQIGRYCYGEQLSLQSDQLFRSIKQITDNDPIILQLMLVILIFIKGISIEDVVTNEELSLLHSKQVYEVQSIYSGLLFRFMIQKYSSYYQAVRRYSQLIQKIIQMQMLVWKYQEILKDHLVDTTDDEINPIVKSVLRLH